MRLKKSIFSPARPLARQDAPFPKRRSRIVQTLNVPIEILGNREYRRGFSVRQDSLYGRTAPRSAVGTSSGSSLAAVLLDESFEPPAGRYCCCCGTREDHRSSRVQK